MFSSADKSLARRVEAGHAQCGRAFVAGIDGAAEPMGGGWADFSGRRISRDAGARGGDEWCGV